MSLSIDTRDRLKEQQAALVTALTCRGQGPDGFDAIRLHAAAESLARKRARGIWRAWPDLCADLGDRFAELFANYAQDVPLPHRGAALADGRHFARWLSSRGELPESGQVQALAVDLRFANSPDGLVPQAWPTCRTTWLRHSLLLILAVRLPWLGEHWLRIPLGWRLRA